MSFINGPMGSYRCPSVGLWDGGFGKGDHWGQTLLLLQQNILARAKIVSDGGLGLGIATCYLYKNGQFT